MAHALLPAGKPSDAATQSIPYQALHMLPVSKSCARLNTFSVIIPLKTPLLSQLRSFCIMTPISRTTALCASMVILLIAANAAGTCNDMKGQLTKKECQLFQFAAVVFRHGQTGGSQAAVAADSPQPIDFAKPLWGPAEGWQPCSHACSLLGGQGQLHDLQHNRSVSPQLALCCACWPWMQLFLMM